MLVKASFLVMMHWSPILLYAALWAIDIIMIYFTYKAKIKEWVVPKIWLIQNIVCLLSYGTLIFLSNMLLGLIITSVLTVFVLICDFYLHQK